jgi:hypothetical protein
MHHVAEQCALSATYVHAVEYALFTLALGLPFALAGFPVYFHAVSCEFRGPSDKLALTSDVIIP